MGPAAAAGTAHAPDMRGGGRRRSVEANRPDTNETSILRNKFTLRTEPVHYLHTVPTPHNETGSTEDIEIKTNIVSTKCYS